MIEESKTVEFKREYVEDIKNTIVAFANCDGGELFVGLNDDGSVHGVDNPDETILKLTNAIRDAIRPDVTLFTECKTEIAEGKKIIHVSVQRGVSRPYFLRGKGVRPEGVYVRQGASTVPATETAILKMIRETAGDSYETARSLNQNLTFEKTSEFFKRKGVAFDQSKMRSLGMTDRDGMYTNLALLLSEQAEHTIKLAVFQGSKKSVFKDRKEITGSLLSQVEECVEYIERINRTRSEFRGIDRIDMRDYPPEAVREALFNAVVHRDYAFSASTLISIFDDRIEFVTIGGLVKGITLDDVFLGVSMPRNRHLADVFYRLRLIEAYGTGILKINECYENCAVKPKIEVSDNAFKITLPNTNFGEEGTREERKAVYSAEDGKDERKTAIIDLCRKQGYATRKEVQQRLAIAQSTAVSLLRSMTDAGILEKRGAARNVKYYLK